jgi:uncharacterized coiled-coil DUF342 family protein
LIKTLMRKAGELEAELKKEMSQLYLRMKEGPLTPAQKDKLAARLKELEKLIGAQKDAACCGTRFFKKAVAL